MTGISDMEHGYEIARRAMVANQTPKVHQIGDTLEGQEVIPGMIIDIYGGTERIACDRAGLNGYGAVEVANHLVTRGLGLRESVTLVGWFNPES